MTCNNILSINSHPLRMNCNSGAPLTCYYYHCYYIVCVCSYSKYGGGLFAAFVITSSVSAATLSALKDKTWSKYKHNQIFILFLSLLMRYCERFQMERLNPVFPVLSLTLLIDTQINKNLPHLMNT